MSNEYYELSPGAKKAVQQRDWSSMLAGITVHKLGENSRSFYDTERNDIYDKKIGDGALGPYGYQDYYQQDFRRGLKSIELEDGLVAIAWIDYVEAYPGFGGVGWEQRSDGFIVDTKSETIVSRLNQGFQTIRSHQGSGVARAYEYSDREYAWHHNAGVSLTYDSKSKCLTTGWVDKKGDVCCQKNWDVPNREELKATLTRIQKDKINAEFKDAVEADDYKKIKECILAGADVDIRLGESLGESYVRKGLKQTPLLRYVSRTTSNESMEIIKLLLDHGANPNAVDYEKGKMIWDGLRGYQTPLMYAAKEGNIKLAKLLIDHGANIDAKVTWSEYRDSNSVFVAGHYETRSRCVWPGTDKMRQFLNKEREEARLKRNLESDTPDREYLRQKHKQLYQDEKAILRKPVLEAEDEKSPRHVRAEKLKALKRDFGFQAAIEGSKKLKSEEQGDELSRDSRKKERQELQEIRKKRKSITQKLADGSLDRKEEADRIHKLRKDIERKPTIVKGAKTKFEKAQKKLADFMEKEGELYPGIEQSNVDRKTMRGAVAELRQKEQDIRSEIRSSIKALAPEKENEQSPRYQRAKKLQDLKHEFGSRAAIEGSKTLKSRETTDEMGREKRRSIRKKLYEQKKAADTLASGRESMTERLLQSSSERENLSQQIHELRRDRDVKKRSLDRMTAELEKTEKDYGDLRKRFKPKPKPQPEPEPIQKSEPKSMTQEIPKPVQQSQPVVPKSQPTQQQATQNTPKPALKPAPRSFWSRLFGRGGNGGNG